MTPAELGAAAAAAAIARGELSSEELVRACLERIDALEPRVRAFVDLKPEQALAQARALDRCRGPRLGALYGVPVAIKEIFDVRGMRCTWGTPLHKSRMPQRDAVAVERLRAAGAIIIGTTVSTEYAIAAAGPTTNPHDASRTPGGSSSGSAAAVAAGMVPLALGSQTLGSTVRPATYCGVYGLKPTFGAISTAGAMPLSAFLDHVGVLARAPEDIELACRALFDHGYCADERGRGAAAADPGEPQAWVAPAVFLVEGPLPERIEGPSRIALEHARTALELRGARVSVTALPPEFAQVRVWLDIILCRDIAANHGEEGARAGNQFSPRLRELIEQGRAISGAQYAHAVTQARRYRNALLELLQGDAIICAAATDGVAPRLTQGTGAPDLQGLYSLTGLPALAVPAGFVEGLPVGVQLVAAPGRESHLLACARAMCVGA